MNMKIIDLSIAIDNDVLADPPGLEPKIHYMKHDETFEQLGGFFPGLKPEQLPGGESWAVELLSLSTHNGTHMDAPWHYHSTQDAMHKDGPRRAMTIDEVPLDWCFRPGVKLDFRHVEDGYIITQRDIEAELSRIGYQLQPLDIVLVNTSAGQALGQPDFLSKGCGIGREATLFLCAQGVRVVGTDAWSWDAPFAHVAERWKACHDPSIIWEGHKAGKDMGYFQMEKLANLEALPNHGFMVSCFPIKIKDASAGWTRAVAMVDNADQP
ncbi:cyclase family protein [Parahaliea mediterranea]|uniref:Cyclase family protein n=1 Tax=Parahaliea mediterranea TaxID=651086 RepID=A0A939DDE1_9GAMM|nr:cyclase family protein [Parahaliea mediterranea]MBN7796178.1 cyclase family protein [Parahaliea mediterranea]